jgi:hypothetical protein
MRILRFVLPFLFVRNWQSGVWELSQSRCLLFVASILLVVLGVLAAYMLQAPVEYTTTI